jgi:predicted PurR-regulated permease PerM
MKPADVTAAAAVLEQAVRLGLLAVASVALAWILLPFYGPILWGCVIAMLFVPLYRWLLPRLWRRHTLTALTTLAVAFVAVVLPLAAVLRSLGSEALGAYERIASGEWQPTRTLEGAFDALPHWGRALLADVGLPDFATVQRRLDAGLAEASQLAATQALGFGQDTLDFVVGTAVMLYLAFFMLRDGELVARGVRRTIPLAPAHALELVERFTEVIRATVKGHLLVAAVQGLLGGLAFWALGVGAPVLWGAVTACLSLIPLVGAALVWLPVAIWFIATGSVWQGVVLIGFGVFVIGLADNLLRPRLVGRDTRLPDYVVLLTTLGGVTVFGINGLLLGPAIAAMFVAVWRLEAEVIEHPDTEGALADRPDAAQASASLHALQSAADDRPPGGEDHDEHVPLPPEDLELGDRHRAWLVCRRSTRRPAVARGAARLHDRCSEPLACRGGGLDPGRHEPTDHHRRPCLGPARRTR